MENIEVQGVFCPLLQRSRGVWAFCPLYFLLLEKWTYADFYIRSKRFLLRLSFRKNYILLLFLLLLYISYIFSYKLRYLKWYYYLNYLDWLNFICFINFKTIIKPKYPSLKYFLDWCIAFKEYYFWSIRLKLKDRL